MAQISSGKQPAEMPNLVPIRQSQRSTRGKSDTHRGRDKVSRVHSEEQEILLAKPVRNSNGESIMFDGPSGIHHVNMSMKNSLLLGDGHLISHIHGNSFLNGMNNHAPYAGDMSSMRALEQDLRELPYD